MRMMGNHLSPPRDQDGLIREGDWTTEQDIIIGLYIDCSRLIKKWISIPYAKFREYWLCIFFLFLTNDLMWIEPTSYFRFVCVCLSHCPVLAFKGIWMAQSPWKPLSIHYILFIWCICSVLFRKKTPQKHTEKTKSWHHREFYVSSILFNLCPRKVKRGPS